VWKTEENLANEVGYGGFRFALDSLAYVLMVLEFTDVDVS
jgi:hypothetical protein